MDHFGFKGERDFPDVIAAGVSLRGLAYRSVTRPDSAIDVLNVYEKARGNEGDRFEVPITRDSIRELASSWAGNRSWNAWKKRSPWRSASRCRGVRRKGRRREAN